MTSAENHGGCNTTCTTCNVSLCISTCTAWAEELAMLWLHGVDNKVHITGREAGADPGFWAQKVSTCACSAYSGRESLGITSLGSGTSVAKWLRVYRSIGVRLLAVSLRPLLPKKFSGDNRTVVTRRPHGRRTLTWHHLPLLCDQTDRRQVF